MTHDFLFTGIIKGAVISHSPSWKLYRLFGVLLINQISTLVFPSLYLIFF